jgi:hypothetical protein
MKHWTVSETLKEWILANAIVEALVRLSPVILDALTR